MEVMVNLEQHLERFVGERGGMLPHVIRSFVRSVGRFTCSQGQFFEKSVVLAQDKILEIQNTCHRGSMQSAVAESLAELGKFDLARDVSDQISDAFWQANARAAIYSCTGNPFDRDRAKELLSEIRISDLREEIEERLVVLGGTA